MSTSSPNAPSVGRRLWASVKALFWLLFAVAGLGVSIQGAARFWFDCASEPWKTVSGRVEDVEIIQRPGWGYRGLSLRTYTFESFKLSDTGVRFVVPEDHPAFPRLKEHPWYDHLVTVTVRNWDYEIAEAEIADAFARNLRPESKFWHNSRETEAEIWALTRDTEKVIPLEESCQAEADDVLGRWWFLIAAVLFFATALGLGIRNVRIALRHSPVQ